jgi:hypothetical protein
VPGKQIRKVNDRYVVWREHDSLLTRSATQRASLRRKEERFSSFYSRHKCPFDALATPSTSLRVSACGLKLEGAGAFDFLTPQGRLSTPSRENRACRGPGSAPPRLHNEFPAKPCCFCLTQRRTNGRVGDSLQSEKVVCGTVFDKRSY